MNEKEIEIEKVKLLVIGNGFDLACGLPTKYTDFMDKCNYIFSKCKTSEIVNLIGGVVEEKIEITIFDNLTQLMFPNILNNVWIYYFMNLMETKINGENWIDFESEISTIIQLFDNITIDLNETFEVSKKRIAKIDNEIQQLRCNIFVKTLRIPNNIYSTYRKFNYNNLKHIKIDDLSLKGIKNRLFNDLQRLILALEHYLLDIENSKYDNVATILKSMTPDILLSFNYTNTAEKMYEKSLKKETIYIHGECKDGSTIDTNNMVLGIDDYWNDERKDTHLNYVIFKKYMQRIQKKTHINIEQLSYYGDNEDIKNVTEIHVYGHSLDITDKDVFYKLFEFEYVNKIIIYSLDKDASEQHMFNLIKIIGRDRFLQRMDKNEIDFKLIPKED